MTDTPKYDRPLRAPADAKLVQAKKETPNKGRWFWTGHNIDPPSPYFQWADQPEDPAPPKGAPTGTRYLLAKRGPNAGRHFFRGTYTDGRNYFQWAESELITEEELDNNDPPVEKSKKQDENTAVRHVTLPYGVSEIYASDKSVKTKSKKK